MIFLTALIMAFAGLPCAAESVEGLPLHVKTIAPGVVRVWAGDHVSSTAVCAIATKKGIVVVDSTDLPKLDQAFRKLIARELGRSDFKYLINTHGHSDHSNGNGIYADCEIIAHERVADMIQANFSDHPRLIAWYKEDIQRQKDEIASGHSNEEQRAAAEERLAIDTLTLEYLHSSPQPVFPTKAFKDKLIMDCGDVTLELYQAGGMHTRSDIFILVPQRGILFTGDMMADKWLTDAPGCLATFAIHTGEAGDYPLLVRNWQTLIDRQKEIRQYVTGHWNGELSYEGFRSRFEYTKILLADIEALAKAKGDFDAFVMGHTLKGKFPNLVGSPGFTNEGHSGSINHLYKIFSGKISVADELMELERENAFATGLDKLKSNILRARDKYFVSETWLNGMGYFLLLQQKHVEDAIRIFAFNAELHPASWNVYDSLAEAYLVSGDKDKAITFYEKSLALNEKNQNATDMLKRLQQEGPGTDAAAQPETNPPPGAKQAATPAGREPLALIRIANSGVMLASGKTKVLIDALFDKAPSDYRSPDPEVVEKIISGAAPFDGVDLALVTHNHPDHFAAPLAVRFLEACPEAILLAPQDAVADMSKEASWSKIAARAVSVDLKVGEKEQREIAGVSLAACRTLHSGKQEEPMNLMYRLKLNGWSVFHEGDADATLDEYRGFGLEGAKTDLALVHFWFPLHPDMAKLLQEVMRPPHVGLIHLPIRLESDAPGKIDMVRHYYQDIFLLLPGMPVKTLQ